MTQDSNPKASPGFFSPTNPLEFLGYSGLSALMGLLSNANPIAFGAVPLIALVWWLSDRRRAKKAVQIKGISVSKVSPKASKALILNISSYSARNQSLNAEVLPKKINELCQNPNPTEKDFEHINLFKSNLLPQIKAVDYHVNQNTLQELWLLPTKESLNSAQLLKKYVDWKYKNQLTVFIESPIEDYNYENIFQVCDRIFKKSPYKEDNILADITGGTKMMSVGLAIACIPQKRQMQYMDQNLDPVVLDLDPILYGEKN